MDNIYLNIIILLMLAYIVDTKIFPQLIIMFLTLAMLLHEITTATDIKSYIGIFILYAMVMLYSSMQIALTGKEEV
jgi:hypothetical protein